MKPPIIKLIKRYTLYIFLAWTAIVIVSCAMAVNDHYKDIARHAAIEAKTYIELNMFYRKVVARFGGVYAPVDKVAPNPYLRVPNRDITTAEGARLTLINPAYLTRLVFEAIQASSPLPVVNKITSLKVRNPVNTPDDWERGSLLSFEKGQEEAHEVTTINGQPYFRLMKPFMVEESCLKCHADQGYQEGDIRGGISIGIPLKPYYDAARRVARADIVRHLLLWSLVSGCLFVFMKAAIRNVLAHEETRMLALHDPLTGLANRRHMELDLQKGVDLASRYGNQLSVIMADIDYFKKYNDTHGHGAGDLMLAKVAGIIQREMRKTDLAARYGGEEFLMVLPQTGLDDAFEVAERIRRGIEAETGITISLGVSAYRQETRSREDIVAEADRALYIAKQKGRNRVEVSGHHE